MSDVLGISPHRLVPVSLSFVPVVTHELSGLRGARRETTLRRG